MNKKLKINEDTGEVSKIKEVQVHNITLLKLYANIGTLLLKCIEAKIPKELMVEYVDRYYGSVQTKILDD